MRRLYLALAFVLCLVSSVAHAAVTDLGNADTFASTQTVALTVTNAVPIGTLVVVFVHDGNSSPTGITVTDSKSNTYTLGFNQTGNPPAQDSIFYSFITTALTTSDTITYHAATGFGANGLGINAASVTGYNAYDSATQNGTNNGFAATFSVTGAGAAAVANEIYFCWVDGNNAPTITGSGTWNTSPPNGITGFTAIPAWQINSGTSALTCSGTLTAQFANAVIVSFKPSGGGSSPPQRALVGVGK